MEKDCGCDRGAWFASCIKYIKSNFGFDKNTKTFFLNGEINISLYEKDGRYYFWDLTFDPFTHHNGGIDMGTLFNQGYEIFGLVYEEADCEHATDRANIVNLARFYKNNRKVYIELISELLPLPIAEEIIPEFFFVHTFNDAVLTDLEHPSPEYTLFYDEHSVKVCQGDTDDYFLQMSKWYLEIDGIFYKWETAGPDLEKYFGQPFYSFAECLNFLLTKKITIKKF